MVSLYVLVDFEQRRFPRGMGSKAGWNRSLNFSR